MIKYEEYIHCEVCLPKRPIIVGQTWLGPRTEITAGLTLQASKDVCIITAHIFLMLLPSDLHNGAIKTVGMAHRIETAPTKALISAT